MIKLILPIYLIQYVLMYWCGLSDKAQWYVYDFGNALIRFLFVFYIFWMFRKKSFNYERQFNYKTIVCVLVFEGYNLLGEALNVNQKGNLFEVLWGIGLVSLLFYSFNDLGRKIKQTL